MPYYQTPTDPVEAARQAQEELIRRAQAARAQEAQRAQQQQAQNTAATIAGMRGMDAIVGGSTAVAPAAEATAASNAVYGGNALVSGVSEASSPWSMSGAGGAGNYIGPVAGGVGITDLMANQRTGRGAYLQGAASGAAMGSYFGPVGTAVGAAAGLGLAGLNETLDTNRFKKEGNRLAELKKKGVNVPDALMGPTTLEKGRSKEELLNRNAPTDFVGHVGTDPATSWTNNQFSQSRNELNLKPEDIWGYSTFLEQFGNDWLEKFNEDQRFAISQKALDLKAVREHEGTVDVDWTNKELNDYVAGIRDGTIKPESYQRVREGVSQMDAATGDSSYSGASPSSTASDFDAMLASSLKQASDQAAASVKASKQSALAKTAISNSQKELPQIQSSGTVRTGVQDLDNILQGVLG